MKKSWTVLFAVIQISLPGKDVKLELSQLQSKLKPMTVTIDDPVYKKQKIYDGFLLTDVLKLAGFDESAGGNEIVFTSVDGYAPNASFEALQKHRAVLTFREHGKSSFDKITQGKEVISPAPFYVVWEEGSKLAEEVPWPYQLVKIEVVDFKQKYSKLYPNKAAPKSDVMQGFVVFKNHCIRCHSINLQGGDLGPELNAPKNVTEYWSKKNLKSFIQDSSSFRYKSKMPPFPNLSSQDINHVIQYFESMKDSKIKL